LLAPPMTPRYGVMVVSDGDAGKGDVQDGGALDGDALDTGLRQRVRDLVQGALGVDDIPAD